MEKVISPFQLDDILQGSSGFYPREYEKRTPTYMGSVLLPRPTSEGKFLSFDVVHYGLPTYENKYTFTIPGTPSAQMCTMIDAAGNIHVPCEVPVHRIGLGSVAYYTTIALAASAGLPVVRSLVDTRSVYAHEWWTEQLDKGTAVPIFEEDSFGDEVEIATEMAASVAARRVYMWRIGSPPEWLQKDMNGKPMGTSSNQELLKSIVRNFPAADRPRMMGNIYPSVPGIAREGVRLAMSNLGYLSSVMKPSAYFPKGMEDYSL